MGPSIVKFTYEVSTESPSAEGDMDMEGTREWRKENRIIILLEEYFWDVTPCSLVEIYKRLERKYYFHLQGESKPSKQSQMQYATPKLQLTSI
jgi:hypothetical protein